MKRFLSALGARPDSGDAPDAVALAVIVLFVVAFSWLAGTLGQIVALWHLGALQ